MDPTQRPRWSRFWRRVRLLALGFAAFAAALAVAVLILEYSQPVWELRVDGPPGTTFQKCVTEYPWWGLGYGFEGYSAPLEPPHVARYRTTRLHPYVIQRGGPGPLRVTLLRNGVVVESAGTDAEFASPVSTPIHAVRR